MVSLLLLLWVQAGQHEGHSYFIYRSACGGCCDCGDASAWAPSGFCSRHSGASRDSDPTLVLPKQTQVLLLLLMRAATRHLVALCAGCQWDKAKSLATELKEACGLHEAFRRCCGRAFLESLVGTSVSSDTDSFADDSLPLEQRLNAAPCYSIYEGLDFVGRRSLTSGIPPAPSPADVGLFNPLAPRPSEEETVTATTAATATAAAGQASEELEKGGFDDSQDWEAEETESIDGGDLLGLKPPAPPLPVGRDVPFSYTGILRRGLNAMAAGAGEREANAAAAAAAAAAGAAAAGAAAAEGPAGAAAPAASDGGSPDLSESIPAEALLDSDLADRPLFGRPPGGLPEGPPQVKGRGPSACAVLLRRAHQAPRDTHGALTTLWLALMFDDWMKERFAVVFMQQYESLVLVGDSALERVTVQVLSIRSLLERLLRMGLLLPHLFACRLSLQQSVSYQGLPPFSVEVRHPMLRRRSYVNSMNDIRYLLAERDLLSECTSPRPLLLLLLLLLLWVWHPGHLLLSLLLALGWLLLTAPLFVSHVATLIVAYAVLLFALYSCDVPLLSLCFPFVDARCRSLFSSSPSLSPRLPFSLSVSLSLQLWHLSLVRRAPISSAVSFSVCVCMGLCLSLSTSVCLSLSACLLYMHYCFIGSLFLLSTLLYLSLCLLLSSLFVPLSVSSLFVPLSVSSLYVPVCLFVVCLCLSLPCLSLCLSLPCLSLSVSSLFVPLSVSSLFVPVCLFLVCPCLPLPCLSLCLSLPCMSLSVSSLFVSVCLFSYLRMPFSSP